MKIGIVDALGQLLRRKRSNRALRVVDQAPLFGAAVVHVVDVDGRRLVFATAPSAICLLAQFECASTNECREEAATQIADSSIGIALARAGKPRPEGM